MTRKDCKCETRTRVSMDSVCYQCGGQVPNASAMPRDTDKFHDHGYFVDGCRVGLETLILSATKVADDGCWSAKVAVMNSDRDVTPECFKCGSCNHCRHDHNTYAYSDTAGSWCRFCDCFNPIYPRLD